MKSLDKACGALAALAIAGAAHAQKYPTLDINMIVPFPAGGPSDIVARIVAEGMSRHLGQIVIENVGGAGGTLGATRASEAAPDGYTIWRPAWARHRGAVLLSESEIRLDQGFRADRHDRQCAGGHRDQGYSGQNLKEFVAWAKEEGPKVKQALAASALPRTWRACCSIRSSASSRRWSPIAARPGDERSDRRARRLPLRAGRQHGRAPCRAARSRASYVATERLPALPDVRAPRRPARRLSAQYLERGLCPRGTPKGSSQAR